MINESKLKEKLNNLTEKEIKELAYKMLVTQEKTRLRVKKLREKNKKELNKNEQ